MVLLPVLFQDVEVVFSCHTYLHTSPVTSHLHGILQIISTFCPGLDLSLFTSVIGTHTLPVLHFGRNIFSTLISICQLR